MKRYTLLNIWFLLAVAVPFSAPANSTAPYTQDQAAQYFDAQKFQEAIAAWSSLEKEHNDDPRLIYNIAAAYLETGQLGEALVRLIYARELAPRNGQIAMGLQTAVAKISDDLTPDYPKTDARYYLGVVKEFTLSEIAFITLIALSIFTCATVISRINHRADKLLRPLQVMVLVLGLITAARYAVTDDWGVVTAPSTNVHQTPEIQSPIIFELRSGSPFRVVQHLDTGFTEIALSDGKRGWLPPATAVFTSQL